MAESQELNFEKFLKSSQVLNKSTDFDIEKSMEKSQKRILENILGRKSSSFVVGFAKHWLLFSMTIIVAAVSLFSLLGVAYYRRTSADYKIDKTISELDTNLSSLEDDDEEFLQIEQDLSEF